MPTRPGPKPLPPEQRQRRVNLTLTHEAVAALEELRESNWSALVSALLVAEAERRRSLRMTRT